MIHNPPEDPLSLRVFQIIRSKGYIEVSHRYRDDKLRTRCGRLAKKGFLFRMPYWMVNKQGLGDPRAGSFYAFTEDGKQCASNLSRQSNIKAPVHESAAPPP